MIPQHSNIWAAMPPNFSDERYWREMLYLEARRARHVRGPRPIPDDLNQNIKRYWETLWSENDGDSTESE